ncbi:MAG: glycosyltransferase [Pseudomonadales bacterium]|nr:glycosyltransferase [Pseudomonadales bacterium]
MKVSVITPVLNGEKFIRQTVDSIINQQGDFELEYIVRDGCSTDNTLAILAEYGNKITVISKKDGSPQEAINQGMKMATGDIKCWLNADDVYLDGTLQAVVSAFKENPNKHWLYGRCDIIDENNQIIRKPITLYKNLIGYFYSRNILLCENYINQPATFWKSQLWDKANQLNPKYKAAWDYELWMKMALESKAIPLRRTLSKFRRHDESISENHFVQQFSEEHEISVTYGNFIHKIIHKLNQLKIVAIYKILN